MHRLRDRRADPRIAAELHKRIRAHKSAECQRSHEIELLLNASVPLAEAINIVDRRV